MVFLGRTKRIHFVGIGGIGMSGIAEVLLNLGFNVTGSDIRESETTGRLESIGATIWYEHSADNITSADVVVYSSAVNSTNPEVAAAGKSGIPAIPRTQMLAEMMRLKFAVTVAGSHGKTSTTSLIASVMGEGKLDPTVIVGGIVKALSANARLGGGRYIVAEADESDGQFVLLPSSIAVITNIDLEHLDFYPNLTAIKDAFVEYTDKVPFYGSVVLCGDDENIRAVSPRIQRRKIYYSLGGEGDLVGEVVSRDPDGTVFRVKQGSIEHGEIRICIPGDHYVRNALAAVAVGIEMEIPFEAIKKGLESFEGVGRRFEIKGETNNGVLIVDDYGHHPTEITATVEAAIGNYNRPLIICFQPHRYSRTQALAEDFASCFDGAAHVFVTDIYAAGEKPIEGVSASTIIDRMNERNKMPVHYTPGIRELVEGEAGVVRPGDMVITMGAGNIYLAGEQLLDRLGKE